MPSDPAPGSAAARRSQGHRSRFRLRRLWYLLLVIEVVAVLIPSIYARVTPKAFGIPFFYWYQLLWIFISMILTGLVYVVTTNRDTQPPSSPGQGGK